MSTRQPIVPPGVLVGLVAVLVGLVAVPGVAIFLPFSTAHAVPVNEGAPTIASLKKKGFKCEIVATGFVVCTKGSVTYWCSGGVCEKKKAGAGARRPFLSTPPAGARIVR